MSNQVHQAKRLNFIGQFPDSSPAQKGVEEGAGALIGAGILKTLEQVESELEHLLPKLLDRLQRHQGSLPEAN